METLVEKPRSFCQTPGDQIFNLRRRIDAAMLVISGHRWTHGPGCECGYCKIFRAIVGDDNKPDPTYSNASHPALDLVAAFHMGETI